MVYISIKGNLIMLSGVLKVGDILVSRPSFHTFQSNVADVFGSGEESYFKMTLNSP